MQTAHGLAGRARPPLAPTPPLLPPKPPASSRNAPANAVPSPHRRPVSYTTTTKCPVPATHAHAFPLWRQKRDSLGRSLFCSRVCCCEKRAYFLTSTCSSMPFSFRSSTIVLPRSDGVGATLM